MNIHPDDIESPRFGGWADDFNTYEEACEFYGADTPAMIRAETAEDLAEHRIAGQDDMEARGGPKFGAFGWAATGAHIFDDEIPF
jgi:hypothetical protein